MLTGIDLTPTTRAVVALVNFRLAQTVTRIHGELLFQLDAIAVDERAVVAWGLIVVPDNVVTVGATAAPHPFTDIEDEWIAHGFGVMSSLAESAVQSDGLFHRLTVDSKAMRKVKDTQSLMLVVEVADSLDQGGTFDVIGGFRVLLGT